MTLLCSPSDHRPVAETEGETESTVQKELRRLGHNLVMAVQHLDLCCVAARNNIHVLAQSSTWQTTPDDPLTDYGLFSYTWKSRH
jgi:hypothetical protein